MEKQKSPGWDWLGKLISLFGLDEYGQDNLSRSMRLTLAQFAIVLLVVALLDLVVWTYQWYLVTENVFMAGALGIIVTVLIVAVNRTILVQSPVHRKLGVSADGADKPSVPWLSRLRFLAQPALYAAFIGLTIALTYFTALTFSVMMFKSEIEHQITRTESKAYQRLVDAAVEKTEREFGRQIEAQEKEGARAAEQASSRVSVDTEAYKKQRSVERASRTESHDAAIRIQKEAAERSEKERNSELDKGAGVRGSGAGKFYRTKDEIYAKQQEQLQKLHEAKIKELREFDAETLQHVAKKESARDAVIADSAKAVQSLRHDMQAKIKELRDGPVGSVPGEWRGSKGFAAQKMALAQIELDDKTGTTTEKRQESHWLMILFGLMSLILKLGLGSKVSAYFDPYAQAARGNKETIGSLSAEGIDDFAAYVRPPEIRDERMKLGDKQQELEMALAAYKMKLAEFAAPVAGSGRFRRLQTIQRQMSTTWREIVEKVYSEVCTQERQAREKGIGGRVERLSGDAFWNVTADQLKDLGWQEPSEEQLAILEAAYQEMFQQREEMFRKIWDIESEAQRIALGEYDTIIPGYQRLRQNMQCKLLANESARFVAAQVVRSFDEETPEAFDLEAIWRKLIKDLDLIALDKAREKFLGVTKELDQEFAITLQSTTATFNGTATDMSIRRRREYTQKLLPIQTFIEELEACYADAHPWIGDPRPFSKFWEITEQQMRDFGWVSPKDIPISDLSKAAGLG